MVPRRSRGHAERSTSPRKPCSVLPGSVPALPRSPTVVPFCRVWLELNDLICRDPLDVAQEHTGS